MAGKDYVATAGTLTINPNSPGAYIHVPLTQDTTFETNETFFITLSNTTANVVDNEAEVTIVNDDGIPVVSISALVAGSSLTKIQKNCRTCRSPVRR